MWESIKSEPKVKDPPLPFIFMDEETKMDFSIPELYEIIQALEARKEWALEEPPELDFRETEAINSALEKFKSISLDTRFINKSD